MRAFERVLDLFGLGRNPYKVTVLDGKFVPERKTIEFKTRDHAVTYGKVMSKYFNYVLLKYDNKVERITTLTKE